MRGMFISKLFYNLIYSLRSKAKIRISHMEKVGFRKVSERFFGGILFCRFDS